MLMLAYCKLTPTKALIFSWWR